MYNKLYIILLLIVSCLLTAVYSQKSKPKTQSVKNSRSILSHSKPVVVKSTNGPQSHSINKQWKTNSALGMFSSWPSKTNKPSSNSLFISSDGSNNKTENLEDTESYNGLKKKEKESFWSKLKLFKKE
tara:strand:- start:1305 stop:1688 length:384 start_codon:yes stop_codon:yes gene_type:complete